MIFTFGRKQRLCGYKEYDCSLCIRELRVKCFWNANRVVLLAPNELK